MKNNVYLIILLLTIPLWHANVAAQDYTTWGLPQGAAARLGKGRITGNIAFSPDGSRLAVATSIGIWIYDARAEQPKPLDLLIGHTRKVTSIAFSPDGTTLASGSRDGTVRLWDVITGLPITVLKGHPTYVKCVAFSPDGTTLASGSYPLNQEEGATLLFWDIPTRQQRTILKEKTRTVTSVAFSPDRNRLVSISDVTGSIAQIKLDVLLWDMKTGQSKILHTEHQQEIVYAGFLPDGNTIVTASSDDTVKLWDATNRSHKMTITNQDIIGDIHFVTISPDGNTIAIGDYEAAHLFNANTGKHKITFEDDGKGALSVAFSPDGNTLATAGSVDNTIKLWNIQTQKLRTTIIGHTSSVSCLTFLPDKKTIVSGNRGGLAYLWDTHTKKHTATLGILDFGDIIDIGVDIDNNAIVTATRYGIVKRFDASKRLAHIRIPKKTLGDGRHAFPTIALSPDAKTIATAPWHNKPVRLWDTQTGRKITTLKQDDTLQVYAGQFSPDGTTLATSYHGTTIHLWDIQTSKIRTTLKTPTPFLVSDNVMAFSPNGTLLASIGERNTVRVWDINTKNEKIVIEIPNKRATCIRFSPDGTLIAIGISNGTTLLYHISIQKNIATLKGHTSGVNAATFSPNGNILATASNDGTILLWKIR